MRVIVIIIAAVVVSAYDCGWQAGRDADSLDDEDVYDEVEERLTLGQIPPDFSVRKFALAPNSAQVITTPGFPEKSPNNVKIMWEFTTTGASLTADFDVFQLRINRKCSQDWVQIVDGLSINDKLCGCRTNLTYSTPSGSLRIFFKTSARYQQRGFNCTITAA